MDLADVCNDSTILTKELESDQVLKDHMMQLESIDVAERVDSDKMPHPQLL